MHITWGQATDTGLVREQNEDAVFSLYVRGDGAAAVPDFGVFIVADGMGGHEAGAKASQIAVQTISQVLLNTILKPILETGKHPSITDEIASAIQQANEWILKEVPVGGATATVVIIVDNDLYVGYVGNVKAYLISQQNIEQLFEVHTLENELIRRGLITRKEADERGGQTLYRALGGSENVDVDTLSHSLIPNTYFLLCTDGLWFHVRDTVIREIVIKTPDPQQTCNQLINLANENYGYDNTSVIVIKVSE